MPDDKTMTKDEAEQYHLLIREIAMCQQSLEELEAETAAYAKNSELIAVLSDTRSIIEARIMRCTDQCERFEAWLAAVSDPQLQSWLYARCVGGMSWVQIAAEANMKCDTVRKAVYRYFAKEAA